MKIFISIAVTMVIFMFALLDFPFLLKYNNKYIFPIYLVLILIGTSIYYVILLEIPISSPSVEIEKMVLYFMKR